MAAHSAADRIVIGLIADIQYADRDSERGRFYRNVLEIVKHAVAAFNARGANAVVTLGDMIDGYCADGGDYKTSQAWPRQSEPCLERVLSELQQLGMPRHDVIGNHELFNFQYDRLKDTGLSLGDDGRTYYVEKYGNWDLIFLNTFDRFINEYHRDHCGTFFEESLEFFKRHRPDADVTVLPPPQGGSSYDLPRWRGPEPHLNPLNGGVSDEQRDWLRETLRGTAAVGRSAIVLSHAPIFGRRAASCLAWNHAEVLAILHEFKNAVHAVISGHYHKGGYEVDEAGIHHVVLPAPLEVYPGGDCWAFLELHEASVRLQCIGRPVLDSSGRPHGLEEALRLDRGLEAERPALG